MKFYSEKTQKLYDTKEELEAAETERERANAEKIAKENKRFAEQDMRKQEVDDAVAHFVEARDKARKLLNSYIDDYGIYNHDGLTKKESDELRSLFPFSRLFF